MNYYLYKITNTVNDKIYLGVHQTENIDDGYMGSGHALVKAQDKYGLKNFNKEILEFFSSRQEMLDREKELVDKDFVLREDTYNLTEGGFGLGIQAAKKGAKVRADRYKSDKDFKLAVINRRNETYKRNQTGVMYDLELRSKIVEKLNSDQAREKSKKTCAERKTQSGSRNSMYGTIHIFNPETGEKKQIKKELLLDYLENGWSYKKVDKTIRYCKCGKQLGFRNKSGLCQYCYRHRLRR